MTSRMERHQDVLESNKPTSRTQKHQNLYEDFYTKTVYKEIESTKDDKFEDREVDLNSMKLQKSTRESYHKVKEIENFLAPLSTNNKLTDLSVFFQEEENKVYDINTALESAKKNREEVDELDRRRKLKNADYNIVEVLAKQPRKTKEEEEKESKAELEELIHTITSRPFQDIVISKEKEELLEDLMPKNLNETVISEDLSKEILARESEEVLIQKEKVDHSFYTRSMDLSDADFDEIATDEFIEKSKPFLTFVKVFVIVLLVIALAVGTFYLMNRL